MPGVDMTQRHANARSRPSERASAASPHQPRLRLRNPPPQRAQDAGKPIPQYPQQGTEPPPQKAPDSGLKFPPSNDISFYSNSDLTLKALFKSPNGQESTVTLQVASTALCIASPVFRAMLSQDKFLEGVGLSSSRMRGQSYSLQLPDDDAESLAILCHIIHLNQHKVPRRLTVEGLARLCILLDKYVCTLAVASWIDFWLAHMPIKSPEPTSLDLKGDTSKIDLMWLYISLVVGDKQRFKFYSSRYIMNAPAYEAMDATHIEWLGRLPSKIQDDLLDVSQDAIESVALTVEEFCNASNCHLAQSAIGVGQMNSAHLLTGNGQNPNISPSECDTRTRGRMLHALLDAGLSSSANCLDVMTITPDNENIPIWMGSVSKYIEALDKTAQGIASGKKSLQKHQHCGNINQFLSKLRELKFKLWQRGLDLTTYKGAHRFPTQTY